MESSESASKEGSLAVASLMRQLCGLMRAPFDWRGAASRETADVACSVALPNESWDFSVTFAFRTLRLGTAAKCGTAAY